MTISSKNLFLIVALFFVLLVQAQQRFDKGLFVKQMKEIVADQKNGFASFKGTKDKKDTTGSGFLLKKPVWGATKSELEVGLNEDSTGMDTYFGNRFKFTLAAKEKFDYAFVTNVLRGIYPAGKYDFSMVDSSMEDGKLYYISFKVVELFSDSFRLTNDRYFFDMVEQEGQQDNKKELNIRATVHHFANKDDAGRVCYWAGNNNRANDSLRKIVANLYNLAKQNKLGSLPFMLLKEPERPTWGDFSFVGDARRLTKTTMKGYSFYIGNASEFAIVKKLGKDANKHSQEWNEFIQQIGNTLPRHFIYMRPFYDRFMLPYLKGKKAGLKAFNGNAYVPFMETDNYKLFAESLMSATTSLAIEENEKEEKTVYAIISFTAN